MAEQPTPSQQQYPPYYTQRRKSNWWIPIVIVGVILILFFAFFALIIGSISSVFSFKTEVVEVKSNSVLYLTLEDVTENAEENPFAFFTGATFGTRYYDLIRAVKLAKEDDRIKGIYYNAKFAPMMSFPQAQELQRVLKDFKESGKFIYAFIEAGREFEYYNALLADSIFMPREGIMEMNGFGSTQLFFKGFLNMIGIDFYVQGFEDFKSAGENLSRKNYSDSARYQVRVILDQIYDEFVNAVSEYRKLDRKFVEDVLARGVYMADSLKELGFIDGFMTDSEVREFIRDKIFGKDRDKKKDKLQLVRVSSYLNSDPPIKKKDIVKDKQIAIIYAVGPIVDQPSDGFNQSQEITAAKIVNYLKQAREDEDIKAIILRVDSPGGSVIASDAIQREIIKTKFVKPVYSSMGNVAASGGYYISMSCDTIIADKLTITGSIGVIMAIPNLSGMINKLDITADTISTSPAANFFNGFYPFTEKEKEILYNMGRDIYYRFVEKVARNRDMTFEQARSYAKGRVWTGYDAQKIGLVDVVGGLDDAIKIAKRRIGVAEDVPVRIQIYPRPADPTEMILKMFGLLDETEDEEVVKTKSDFAKMLNLTPKAFDLLIGELPESAKNQIYYNLQLLAISKREKVIAALPYYFEIK